VPDDASERTDGKRRAVDRLINFSDAVVAVAITVLALPLVDIEGPAPGESVWPILWDHAPQISTFLFTFFVLAIMWLAHNRVLNEMRAYDGVIFWLNTTWLAGIVLLPWFSALYGETSSRSSVGLVYWGALALISVLGALMGRHMRAHPELSGRTVALDPKESRRLALRGPVFAGYFLLIGLVSLVLPDVASWMPFGIIILSIWFRPVRSQQSEETA
jgi:uncharacterized membrane protein